MPFDYKIATPVALRDEFNRIALVTGDINLGTRRELAHLPSLLADGEEVLAFCSGITEGNTWLIVLTGQRVLFLDKGILYGLRQMSIDLDKINAVGGETGLVLGTIRVRDGATEYVIENVLKRSVVPFTQAVQAAMRAHKRALAARSPHTTGEDVIMRLERLAALRSSGALSQDEFTQQKARILAA